jgi:hypothetical protein
MPEKPIIEHGPIDLDWVGEEFDPYIDELLASWPEMLPPDPDQEVILEGRF